MTQIEKMKELLSLPVEELAEKIVTRTYTYKIDGQEDLCGLDEIFTNEYVDPRPKYCLAHYEDICPYLDSSYDPECTWAYGTCNREYDKVCSYSVNRRRILKDYIIQELTKEYGSDKK